MWTLDELVERVRRSLAAEYAGAPNGRVRDLPDRRAVRWYTTTGLVDRPLGMRGRTALYGDRHLLQLVALKRRQAEGRTLAQIQAELTGASDAELTAVARVPADLLNGDGNGADAGPVRPRFWADPVRAGGTGPAAGDDGGAAPADGGAAPVDGYAAPVDGYAAPVDGSAAPAPVGGVVLGGGAILVLPGLPTGDVRREIAAAARPLIDLLAERGLLEDGSPS